MNKVPRGSPLLLGLVIAQSLFIVTNSIFGLVSGAFIPLISIGLSVVITTMHALKRYSLTEYLVFALIAFVISNFYENLSILTEFPFGHYYYSDKLGPKLFLVPLLIAPSYFAVGYFAWTIGHILLGIFNDRPRGRDVVMVPVIASFVMVMWDLVMDPGNSTINKSWFWLDGGSYFGVPFSNFMGWLLCVYTIFQMFALYLAWRAPKDDAPPAITGPGDKGYWYLALPPYFIMSFAWLIRTYTAENRVITDPSGQQWQSVQLYETMFLVAIFTMWFVTLLSAMLISRYPDSKAA